MVTELLKVDIEKVEAIPVNVHVLFIEFVNNKVMDWGIGYAYEALAKGLGTEECKWTHYVLVRKL